MDNPTNSSDELDLIFEDMAFGHNFDYGKKAVDEYIENHYIPKQDVINAIEFVEHRHDIENHTGRVRAKTANELRTALKLNQTDGIRHETETV